MTEQKLTKEERKKQAYTMNCDFCDKRKGVINALSYTWCGPCAHLAIEKIETAILFHDLKEALKRTRQ